MKAIAKIMVIVVMSIFLRVPFLYSCSSLVTPYRSSAPKYYEGQCKNGLIILGSLPPALAPLVFGYIPELGCAFGRMVCGLHLTRWNGLNPTWKLSPDATLLVNITFNGECIDASAPGECYVLSYFACYDTKDGLCEDQKLFYHESYRAFSPPSITWLAHQNAFIKWTDKEEGLTQEEFEKTHIQKNGCWLKKVEKPSFHVPDASVYSVDRGRVVISRKKGESLIESELWLLPDTQDIQPHTQWLPGSKSVLAACVALAKKQDQKEWIRKHFLRLGPVLERLSWAVRL